MNRTDPLDGVRRMIRILAERFGVVPAAISDLRLTADRLRNAKLIIIPSAEFLSDAALDTLRACNAKLLFTGSVNGEGSPVEFHEMTANGWATFDRNLRESLLKGRGGLPLEFAREDQPLIALLREALVSAGVETQPSDSGVAVRLLESPRAVLAVFINDSAQDAQRRVTIAGHAMDVPVPAGRSRLMLFERATGRVIAQRRE